MEKLFAWLVHLYTAMGLVAAGLIAVLIVRGGDESFRQAFALMGVATAIDSTDGWLARKARVKEVLPHVDGGMLDNIIDFHLYTSLPLLLVWRAEILSGGLEWFLLLPLLASAYGFSQTAAKTADGYFLGFPSYWNIVAVYLYVLRPPVWSSLAVFILFSILTFVPTRYLYLTRGKPFARPMLIGGTIWAMLVVALLFIPAGIRPAIAAVSLVFPAVYLGLSWTSGQSGDRAS